MIVFLVNGVFIIDYKNIIDDEINTDYLSDHTMNTWQSDRTAEDKLLDTLIGKHAEAAVETALKVIGITDYHSYDSFRADDFKEHAPFDGVICSNNCKEIFDLVNETVKEKGNKLSAEVRKEINRLGGKTVEIKSTRLAQKYKDRVKFTGYNSAKKIEELIESLMGLDFLTYPFFSRYGDMTFDQYCWYAETKHLHTYLRGEELRKYVADYERDNSADIYIRVFMDEENSKALIMGWIDKDTFYTNPETHKLILNGKSEVPLYFVKKLKKGLPIVQIHKILK